MTNPRKMHDGLLKQVISGCSWQHFSTNPKLNVYLWHTFCIKLVNTQYVAKQIDHVFCQSICKLCGVRGLAYKHEIAPACMPMIASGESAFD